MTAPTTLGELLRGASFCRHHGENECTESYWPECLRKDCHNIDARTLRRILYGTDEPCSECNGRGWSPNYEEGIMTTSVFNVPCPTCHGTGRLKTPGVVERLSVAAEHTQLAGWPEGTYHLLDTAAPEFTCWLDALRREIGETW